MSPEVVGPLELRAQQREQSNELDITLLVLTFEVLVVVVLYGVGFSSAAFSASSTAIEP